MSLYPAVVMGVTSKGGGCLNTTVPEMAACL